MDHVAPGHHGLGRHHCELLEPSNRSTLHSTDTNRIAIRLRSQGLTVAVAVLATAQRHVAVAVDEAAQSSLVGPTVHTVAPVAPVAAVAIPATPNTTFAAAAAAATDTDIDTATADITSATAPSRHNHVADEHQKPVAMCYYLLADALLPCSVVGGSPYAHPYNATAAAATTDAAPIMPTATATVTVTAAKAPTSSSEGIYPGVVPGPEFRPGFKDLAAVLPASAHPSADAAAAPVTTASPPADTASSLRASSLYLSWTTLGYYPDVHNSDPEPRPALAAQESNPEPRPARPAFDHKWGRVGIAVVRPSGPAGTRLMVDPTTASAASAASATQVAPSTTAASTTASRTVPMVTVTVWVTPTTTAA